MRNLVNNGSHSRINEHQRSCCNVASYISTRHIRKLIKDNSIKDGMIVNSYRFKRPDIIEYANSKFKNKKINSVIIRTNSD